MTADIRPATAEHWAVALTVASQRLNFNDPRDRSIFRARVRDLCVPVKVNHLRDLAAHFGAATPVPLRKTGAVSALANAWMDRAEAKPALAGDGEPRVYNANLAHACTRCNRRFPRMYHEDGVVVCGLGQCRPHW